ncbi:MAG TPA: hypothetical protein VNA20_10840 [Frankiaceae bacterium]|nr:hypothetical protein [Frankiaceae bacterium]
MSARARRSWVVPVLGALIAAVLSSGVTAAYFLSTMPDTVALPGDLLVTPEYRHVAALLVAPAEPFRPVSAGAPVDRKALGAERLAALGFRRGWMRTWRAPGAERVDSFVLEFGDEPGAAAYARGIGRAARLLERPRPFTVTGVPGSSGLADTVRDREGKYAQLVALHRGRWAVLLVFATNAADPGTEVLGLAQRQWAALART